MFRSVLLRILETYFRRPLINLLPFMLITAPGIAYVQLREPVYISNASIAIQEESITETTLGLASREFVWRTAADATVTDIQELFASDSIIRSIVSRTDLEQSLQAAGENEQAFFDGVRRAIWVQSVGAQHFVVSARANNPELAQQLTASVITTFLNWNSNLGLADAAASIDFFEDQLAKESAEFEEAQLELRQFLTEFPDTFRGERSEVQQLELDRLTQLANQAAARVSYTRDRYSFALLTYKLAETETEQQFLIIDQPTLPNESEHTPFQSAKVVVLFAAAGIVATLLLLFLRAALDKTCRYPVDVKIKHGLPVLASVSTSSIVARPRYWARKHDDTLVDVHYEAVQLAVNIEPPTMVLIERDKEQIALIARERSEHS